MTIANKFYAKIICEMLAIVVDFIILYNIDGVQRQYHSLSGFTLPVGTTGEPPPLTPPYVSPSLRSPPCEIAIWGAQLRM